jgi:hypothetical protein
MGGDDAEPVRGVNGMALEEGGLGGHVAAAEQGAVGGSGDDELGGGRKGGRAALESGGGSKELLDKEANLGTVGLDADETGVGPSVFEPLLRGASLIGRPEGHALSRDCPFRHLKKLMAKILLEEEGRENTFQMNQQQEPQEQQSKQQSKPQKSRCAQCKCKLVGVKFDCKCKQTFCVNHITAAAHACSFDYRAEGAAALVKQLDTTGLSEKLTRI